MDYVMDLGDIEVWADILKLCFINLCTYYMNFKMINAQCNKKRMDIVVNIAIIIFITLICKFIKDKIDYLYGIVSSLMLVGILFSRKSKSNIGYSLIVTMISLTINYTILALSIFFSFFIFFIFDTKNECINIMVILTTFIILVFGFSKIKRFNKGLSFLKVKIKNDYFDILIINVSCVILFSITILSNYMVTVGRKLIMGLIIFVILMFVTIQKSLQLYYKQRMLVKDLEETKEELENKKKEVETLEKENLEFSKVSHSIAHKQKSLEHKLNELSMKSEIADELDIKDRIKNIDKDLREKTVVVLDKTGIDEIDDMLSYMQSECVKNKIDFQLQLNGNIYTMINHHIDKEDLEILLADHIKNAIIAIEYGDNVNKSILVRLGKLDGGYGLYIYDSGIEFEIGTLLNLGKKPSTTHKESGGTGMGFMNTFDTLRKHKASFVIEELGKPVKNNFTKVLKFKFDGKNEFKISSYRKEEIKNTDKDNSIVVEKLSL